MQLILDAESTDIDFKETMSTVDQESLGEKPLANGQVRSIQDSKIERPNGNKENILNKDSNIIKDEHNINVEDKESEEATEQSAQLVKDDKLTDEHQTKVNLIFNTDNASDKCGYSEGDSIANDAKIETESRSEIVQEEEETGLDNKNEHDRRLVESVEVDKETKNDKEQGAFLGKKALSSNGNEEEDFEIRKRDHLEKETDKDKDLRKEENSLEQEVDLPIDIKLDDRQINKENFSLSKELSSKEVYTMEEVTLPLENTAIITNTLDSAALQDEVEAEQLKANDHSTESLNPFSIEDQQKVEQTDTIAIKTDPSDIVTYQDEPYAGPLEKIDSLTGSNDPMSIEDQQQGQPETTAIKTKPSDIVTRLDKSEFGQFEANDHSTSNNDHMSIEDQQEVGQPEITAIKTEPSDIFSHLDEPDCGQLEVNDNINGSNNDPMSIEDQQEEGQPETTAVKTEPSDIVTHQDEPEIDQLTANDNTTESNNDPLSIADQHEIEQPYTTGIKTEPSDVTYQDEPEVEQLEANAESSNSLSTQNDQEVGQPTSTILKSESLIQNESEQEQFETAAMQTKTSEPTPNADNIETDQFVTVVKTELFDSTSEQDKLEVTKTRKTAVKVRSTEPVLHKDEDNMQVETLRTQELEENIMDCDEKPIVHINENNSQSLMDCEDIFEITATKKKDLEHPAINCDIATKDIEMPTKQDVLPLAMDIEQVNKITSKETTKDVQKLRQELLDADEIKETVAENKIEIVNNTESVAPEKNGSKIDCKTKNVKPMLSRLSNTLDILSDDEDEPPKSEESQNNKNTNSTDKQCINIEDDDDIMVIDEDTNSKDAKNKTVKVREAVEVKQIDNESKSDSATINLDDFKESECRTGPTISSEKESTVPDVGITDSSRPQINEKLNDQDEKYTRKPLVPDNFFKTYKKNLTDMTRDDLEEFCILKIVESIIDRSNLNEIRSKLKTMAQSIEEYKKKAASLTKQNRDLQVVLKSVQEEQKKVSDTPISPLKITRSVGMQVLMTDKNSRRKLAGPSFGVIPNANNNINSRPIRSATNQSPRQQKPVNTQQIPVPRLVPASNNTAIKSPSTNHPVNTVPKPSTTPVPNGNKISPIIPKAEKRSHNRLQSVTVDLTDDEPPSKVPVRNNTGNPVRLVSPQNLLAPRQQITQSSNSPRKVYIPIGGPPGSNVRPGQTIMLKSVPSSGPRPRGPINNMVRLPQNSVRMPRVQNSRHPAPLPDAMKQYQPPNWKALPPAPDLKLSKVENGIVISWKIEGYQDDSYEEIASYQLYAYQETSAPPCTTLWKKIGDVKALPLPMACTLTQFMAGFKYYFAVRAVDVRSRLGPFSLPGSILLLNKV